MTEEKVSSRNLRAAIVTGLSLASLVLALLFWGPVPFLILVVAVVLVAQAEFYQAVGTAGHDPAVMLGLVAGGVLMLGTYARGESAVGLVLFLTVVFTFIWYLALEKQKGLIIEVAVTLFGVAYIPLLAAFVILVLRREPYAEARGLLVAVIGAAAVYDIFAYALGSRFGRRPLAPSISPGKTIEGSIGATIGLLIVGPPLALLLGPWNYFEALVFCLFVSIAAPLGDLTESMLKRDLGIKDMGGILPGHGGMLDRIDAILFSAPAAFLSLRLFGL